MVEVESRRGRISAPARIGDMIAGHVFVPFHYGYWDEPDRSRAANELTMTEWDPVSKQPYFKHAAGRVQKVKNDSLGERIAETAAQVGEQIKHVAKEAIEAPAKVKKAVIKAEGERPIAIYIGMAHKGDEHLAEAFTNVAQHHVAEPDIYATCMLMAQWSTAHVEQLKPLVARYQEKRNQEPDRLRDALFQGPRSGGIGLLRDLTDLWLAVSEVHCSYECLVQAAKALRDKELLDACISFEKDADRQLAWLRTRIDQAAPQALTVT